MDARTSLLPFQGRQELNGATLDEMLSPGGPPVIASIRAGCRLSRKPVGRDRLFSSAQHWLQFWPIRRSWVAWWRCTRQCWPIIWRLVRQSETRPAGLIVAAAAPGRRRLVAEAVAAILESSGGSSVVELLPSKQAVASSNLVPRSSFSPTSLGVRSSGYWRPR